MAGQYRFQDIFDIEELQKLMDAFSKSFEVGMCIRSPEGEKYVEDSQYCSFCRDYIKKSPQGARMCEESDRALSAYCGEKPFICNCKSAGLVDAVVNINIGDVHIASILIGQVRILEYELPEEEYRRIARNLKLDEKTYLSGLKQIPRKTMKQFEAILQTMSLVASQLSEMGYKNLYQRSVIDSMLDKEQLLEKEKEVLADMAERDVLTGLYNRRKFEKTLAECEKMTDHSVCIISADANNLKLTNDFFGHRAGDQLLLTIASAMKQLAAPNWVVARCGGDEFCAVLFDITQGAAEEYCKHVQRICMQNSELAVVVSVSMGAAVWRRGEESLQDCLKRADDKMYRAKEVMQEKQNFPDYVMERLFNRQIVDRRLLEQSMELAREFCTYLKLPESTSQRVADTIHYQDLGLIQMPEHILFKHIKRTDEAWEYMHRHPVAGAALARQFDRTYKLAEVILQTHESWDGRGYPKGLAGEQICLEARLARLVDGYVLWSNPTDKSVDRSYPVMVELLKKKAGDVLDPHLVEQFLGFLEDKRKGRTENEAD